MYIFLDVAMDYITQGIRIILKRGFLNINIKNMTVILLPFTSRDAAFAEERKIKGWSRKKKEALIARNWEELKRFAKKKF